MREVIADGIVVVDDDILALLLGVTAFAAGLAHGVEKSELLTLRRLLREWTSRSQFY